MASGGTTRSRAVAWGTWTLLVALTFATWEQGAFYRGPFLVVLGLAAVATVLVVAGRPSVNGTVLPLLGILGAAIAVNVALTPATWTGSRPTIGVVLLAGAGVAVGAASDDRLADRLLTGLLAVAGLASVTAWLGVATHHEPWALVVEDLWRGSSTITYANATAALAAVGLVLGTARLLRRPDTFTHVVTVTCAVGVLVTASRAGWLSAGIGLLVLARTAGWRRTGQLLARLALPAGVVLVGLVPSLDAAGDPHPALAVLAVGAAALVGSSVRHAPSALVVLGLLLAVAVGSGLWADRLTVGSVDRGHEWSAAAEVISDHPVVGAGTGELELAWTDGGRSMRAQFVHNEYLELVATQGLLGLGALVACALFLRRRWRPVDDGVLAALVVIGVHSAFDFLWHVPVLPLTAALLVGLGVRASTPADRPTGARSLTRV